MELNRNKNIRKISSSRDNANVIHNETMRDILNLQLEENVNISWIKVSPWYKVCASLKDEALT